MSRCIDADVLKEDIAKQLKACKFIFGDSISELLEDSMDGVYRTIDRQPTVDVVEVKHGEWIELYENNYKCSACGDWWETIEGTPQDNGMNYCPHCGAKMGERRKE